MSAPENGAKALIEVRKTEMVGENGLKPLGFQWKSHYLKTGGSLPQLAASYSDGMDVSTYAAVCVSERATEGWEVAATALLCHSGGSLQPLNRRLLKFLTPKTHSYLSAKEYVFQGQGQLFCSSSKIIWLKTVSEVKKLWESKWTATNLLSN